MAYRHYPITTPLVILWHFSKPDGTTFSLDGYSYRLYYRNGNRETEAESTMLSHDGNILSFVYPADAPRYEGEYSLRLDVFRGLSNNKFITINYQNAFVLSRLTDSETPEEYEDTEPQSETVHLFTVAQYALLQPIIPTVGADGYWYVDGIPVVDGSGNYVTAEHTMRYDATTHNIIIDEGRTDPAGVSIEQTITGIADYLQYWNGQYEAAETARDTSYGQAEGSRLGSIAGDGSRWGSYLAAEAQRNSDYSTAEGQRNTDYGNAENARDGQYNTAEAGRDNRAAAAEGTKAGSSAGDGSRWGEYKSQEAQRNTDYSTAEGSRNSQYNTAEGNRNTAYSGAENARDGLYDTAEQGRDSSYNTAEGGRNTSYNTAEGQRNASYSGAEGQRNSDYSTAESNRDSQYAAAEGSKNGSVAGDGSRWGTFKTNEAARDQEVQEAISQFDQTKADKDTDAVEGNFAMFDANGNPVDSNHKHSDYLTEHQDISGKADKDTNATEGNLAVFDANGNPVGSNKKPSDFLESQEQADWSEADNTKASFIKNKPTIGSGTLTIQKNGTAVDTFNANATQDKTINITVPTQASDVDALPDTTKYGATIALSIDDGYKAVADPTGKNPKQEGWYERSGSSPDYVYTLTEDTTPVSGKTYYEGPTFVITAQLKDQNGDNLGSAQTIDLPLESVVVDGYYDENTKKVVLVLENGSKIEFSVADLISGLQPTIDADHKLSADLVADGNTNKVFTATEKTKLANIAAGAEVNVQSDWNQSDNSADDYIKNKPQSMKNPAALTFGQKTYDGSEAKEITASDLGAITDISGKADKDTDAVEGNFAAFDSNGNPVDSGHKHSDYLTSHQDISGKADKVIGATEGHLAGLDSNGDLTDSDVYLEPAPRFGGLEIAAGELMYDGSKYAIANGWKKNSYSSKYGKTAGSYYHSFVEMGQLFEKANFSNSDGDITNELNPLNGWRIPTKAEWQKIFTDDTSVRAGSKVNGSAGKHYAMVQLTGVTFAGDSTPYGVIVFPDGATISGKALSGTDSLVTTTGVTEAELDVYLAQGCAFLPAAGIYASAGWLYGGDKGEFWSTNETEGNNEYAEHAIVSFIGVSTDYGKKSNYLSVRLVKESNGYRIKKGNDTVIDADTKVDKEQGKGLSTNDYTTAEKEKLAGIAAGAEVNVQSDWSQSDDSADDFIKNKPTIPDVSGKADKVSGGTENNFAALDANGNLKDSGHKHSDYLTSHQDISGKANKVTNAKAGNFANLKLDGDIDDSGISYEDIENMARQITLDTVSRDLSYFDAFGHGIVLQETANTYVVPRASDKYYKFPLVYGNGIHKGKENPAAYTRLGSTYTADFVNHLGEHITSPFIEENAGCHAASAGLLWQTSSAFIDSVELEDGVDCRYLRFHVNNPAAVGSDAVLYVKDANNDIIWSWMIWAPASLLSVDRVTNYTGVHYDFLSENLGALVDNTSYRINPYYQWGRKDPMCPAAAYNSGSNLTLYDISGNTYSGYGVLGTDGDQSAQKTVANAIKNPNLFFVRYDTTIHNWNNLSWFNNFWNAAMTDSGDLADNQATAIKTIYDPCPVGFMLPAGRAWTGFTTTGTNSGTSSEFNVVGSFDAGWKFKKDSEDAAGVYYPASGYRSCGSGGLNDVGGNGYCWSFAPYSQTYARRLYFGSGGVYPLYYDVRAYGFSVRPSRELS